MSNLNPKQFFHNTDAALKPGDEILPAAHVAKDRERWKDLPTYSPHVVYMHDGQGRMDHWQHGHRMYEVEPVGPVGRDPEFLSHARQEIEDEKKWNRSMGYSEADDPVIEDHPSYGSYVAPRARVKRLVETREPQDHYRDRRPSGPVDNNPLSRFPALRKKS